MDSSEVGRFGTLRLMKRLEPHKVVASYPIDDEEVTFGRDPSCSIRLYYESVSALHCKLIFRERKAFLVVLGTNGLMVDGCSVFPTAGLGSSPITVPLPNNSSIEINKKTFQFSYPPKELRQTLLDTPTRPDEMTPDKKRRRRTLRMSMIQSAQVFTPRPSQDPRENLRILKTPIKTPFSKTDRRQSEEENEDIVLVETNHPKVLEEDRDLVILEQVTVEFPIPESAQAQVQQTPQRRRVQPRASLHRAVLIRSAQRTALKIEMEREEEQEAEEVEETIQALDGLQEADEDEDDMEMGTPLSGWRKGLGLVTGWALRQSPEKQEEVDEVTEGYLEADEETPEETPTPEPDDDESMDIEDEPEEIREHRSIHTVPIKSPPRRRPLGKFTTPQASRVGPRGHVRYSVGGFTPGGIHGSPVAPVPTISAATIGPRRVRVVEPWKVEDIVIPTTGEDDEEEEEYEDNDEVREMSAHAHFGTVSPSKRPQVSEEERKAIIERRRSALTAPDTFFGGQTPGSRRMSLFPSPSPMKPPVNVRSTPIPAPSFTAEESSSRLQPEKEIVAERDLENEEDAQVLLARMKQMVEGVKRRQSIGPRPSVPTGMALTPKRSGFSLLAPEASSAPIKRIEVGGSQEDDEPQEQEGDDVSDKENNVRPLEEAQQDMEDLDMDAEGELDEDCEGEAHGHNQLQRDDLNTPSFKGVREMFAVRPQLATPRMDGVRELFREERIMATPAFDGLGEMLEPPAGRAESAAAVEHAPARRGIAPLRRTTPRTAPSTAKPVPKATATATRITARKARGKAAESETEQEEPEHAKPPSTTTPTPTPEDPPAKAKTPTLTEVEEEEHDSADGDGASKEEDEDESTALTDKQETLRGRKPATTLGSTTRRATPGTVKGASDSSAPVTGNKENTPEPQTTPEDDQPQQLSGKPPATATRSAAKVKVTRSVGKARAASEDVVEKETVAAAGTRVSRTKARK
ncbi:hypothetical protein BC835DRAFT_1405935 [Cytidiella melzeri]|nr:hypothetical protein BC835DRAFT_1405935 [Cytidiella melzeri]